MRRYADPVEVRQGPLESDAGGLTAQRLGGHGAEGPQQFLWRGRLWKVRAVLAHWVETGPWWQSAGVRAVVGSDDPVPGAAPAAPAQQLLVERELWRVEAGRGSAPPGDGDGDGGGDGGGGFDLSLDWSEGRWQLVGCAD